MLDPVGVGAVEGKSVMPISFFRVPVGGGQTVQYPLHTRETRESENENEERGSIQTRYRDH